MQQSVNQKPQNQTSTIPVQNQPPIQVKQDTVGSVIPAQGATVQPKVDLEDVFTTNERMKKETQARMAEVLRKKSTSEELTEKASSLLGGSGNDVEEDLKELDKISEEDMKLAEEMIFNGYAEKTVSIPRMPKFKYIICSTSADDVAMVDEIIFEMIRNKEDVKGNVNLAENVLRANRTALSLALSVKSLNEKEICEENSIYYLTTIKKAIIKVKDLEFKGDIKSADELKIQLKKSIIYRGSKLMKMATPVIDFLSKQKYEFDNMMFNIMNSKEIIPKS